MHRYSSIRLFVLIIGLFTGQIIDASCPERTGSAASTQAYKGINKKDPGVLSLYPLTAIDDGKPLSAIIPTQDTSGAFATFNCNCVGAASVTDSTHVQLVGNEGGSQRFSPSKPGLSDYVLGTLEQTVASLNVLAWNNERLSTGLKADQPGCGDGICQIGEDSGICPADCKHFSSISMADLIVDRSQAPRGVKLPDGSVLIGVKRTISNRNVIQALARNQPNGKWVIRGTVEENNSPEAGDLGNPMPFVETNGRLLMAFRDHISAEGREKTYQLRVEYSDDDGLTWNRWGAERGGVIDVSSYGLWEPFLYYDAYGELRVVYAKERARQYCKRKLVEKQDIVTKVSRDGGRSWTDENIVASAGLSRDGVPSVARLRDASYVLVFESWRNEECDGINPKLVIRSMQSRDGVHWGNRNVVYMPIPVENAISGLREEPLASWPYTIRLQDGRLLVLFTTDENFRKSKMNYAAREREYDIKYLLTKYEASCEHIEWGEPQAQTAYAMKHQNEDIKYASGIELDGGDLMVMFARPARYGILELR